MKEHILSLKEFGSFFSFLIEKFGEENVYFTLLVMHNDGEDLISTFASDNLHQFPHWLLMQQTKMVSGRIKAISFILRIFTDRMFNEKIPYKEIYAFYFAPEGNFSMGKKRRKGAIETEEVETLIRCLTFNEKETEESFRYDAFTGEELPLEPSEIYLDSTPLMEEFMAWK